MPMWLAGVPERQTTAVSSSKIGARKVAPASCTPATTPSADAVHQLEHVVGRVEHPPHARTGAVENTFVPVPSVRRSCGRDPTRDGPNVSISAVDPEDSLLHQLRVRGMVAGRGRRVAAAVVDRGLRDRAARSLMLTPAGRAEADAAFRVTGPRREPRRAHRGEGALRPLNQRLIQICNDWQVRAGGVAERPPGLRSTTGR